MNLDVLLPILRKDRDGWEEIAPCWPVAPGIAVYLAEVTPTPEGGQKIAYVLKQHLTSGTPKASALLERAKANLRVGLQNQIMEIEGGSVMRIARAAGFGASAVTLDDFHRNAMGWFSDATEFLVAVPAPEFVMLTPADGPAVAFLRELARKTVAAEQVVNLAGATFFLGPGGVRPDPDGPSPAPAAPPAKTFWQRLVGR